MELLLRDARHEALQASKHLPRTLPVHGINLRLPNQLLDANQTITNKMAAQLLVDLGQHQVPEPVAFALADLDDLISEATLHKLLRADPLAHKESFVAPGRTQARDEGTGRAALCHKTNRRERRQQKGLWSAVNEVSEARERRRQPDNGSVEAHDEDFGVRREGMRDVEVEGDKRREPVLVCISAEHRGCRTRE